MASPPHARLRRVDAIRGQAHGRREAQVGRREAQLAAALLAVDDGAHEREGAAQERGGGVQLAARHELAGAGARDARAARVERGRLDELPAPLAAHVTQDRQRPRAVPTEGRHVRHHQRREVAPTAQAGHELLGGRAPEDLVEALHDDDAGDELTDPLQALPAGP